MPLINEEYVYYNLVLISAELPVGVAHAVRVAVLGCVLAGPLVALRRLPGRLRPSIGGRRPSLACATVYWRFQTRRSLGSTVARRGSGWTTSFSPRRRRIRQRRRCALGRPGGVTSEIIASGTPAQSRILLTALSFHSQ